MREQTQFVAFWEDVIEARPKFLNNFRIRPQGIKNADKRTAILVESTFEEALMKTFAIARNSNEVPVKELTPTPKPVPAAKEVMPVEMQPTFTLTFTLGTRMRELHDTIIRTVLQYTRGNRLRAAQLLQINPRTIRRRLGKKETADSVTRAA
ncbi:MAG: helix-turn-helix domain-containing protein [Terriglobia bacterium]|jgi:DNA-binding NtrC family response regulator